MGDEEQPDKTIDGDDSEESDAEEADSPGTTTRRSRIEGLLQDGIRGVIERGLEAGLGTLNRTDKVVRGVVGGELPRELVGYVFSQVDETKNAMVRVVAREVREFLEATDLAQELQRALTSLSFEVKTEIRFIPNEAGGIRPDVKAKVRPKSTRRWRRGRAKEEEQSTSSEGENE